MSDKPKCEAGRALLEWINAAGVEARLGMALQHGADRIAYLERENAALREALTKLGVEKIHYVATEPPSDCGETAALRTALRRYVEHLRPYMKDEHCPICESAIAAITLCVGCGQPRSFHKADKCPHLDVAGAVETWGPEVWQQPHARGTTGGPGDCTVCLYSGQCARAGRCLQSKAISPQPGCGSDPDPEDGDPAHGAECQPGGTTP